MGGVQSHTPTWPHEEWRSIAGAYEVSSLGRVRRVAKSGHSYLKTRLSRNGYPYVTLGPRANRVRHHVHRLMAEAFLGPANGFQVNHIDGVKGNNAVSNLEYVTRAENMRHAARLGLTASGDRNGGAKVSSGAVAEMRGRAARGVSAAQLARDYGITRSSVHCILRRKTWRHVAS